ncbi:DUF883 family protein [Kushneria indalinina]|uniref:ElaB/YqjD/DUF883 family membrane-anchored ribosome-binding protein n=1 Tax=Kushneria indalinina DSM 14324 TaxID=1122140 RepID=A0A3D9DUT0_9GAMM|nr:DUF883 family protein [Kushneria indalinina]REC94497.1 ElaB/YqjD/DUF883 family membrane-anchored ribosome-binding protein [Kushneria indalinina DSM 14324]
MAMKPIRDNDTDSQEQLREDLRQLSGTIEELMHATADDSRENVARLRERAEAKLVETRERLSASGERVRHQAQDSMECADQYVRSNPWKSVGYGAAMGVVVGLILGRS